MDDLELLPLFMACHRGNAEMVRLLLQYNNNSVNRKNKQGYTPLMVACMAFSNSHSNKNSFDNYVKLIRVLVDDYGANVNATADNNSNNNNNNNNSGNTALHFLFWKNRPENQVNKHDDDDNDDITTLHEIITDSVTKFLMQRGAFPRAQNAKGKTPLDYFNHHHHHNRRYGTYYYHEYYEKQRRFSLELIRTIWQTQSVDRVGQFIQTIPKTNHDDSLDFWNFVHADGNTILHEACRCSTDDRIAIVRLILQQQPQQQQSGVNVNIRNGHGQTALHMLCDCRRGGDDNNNHEDCPDLDLPLIQVLVQEFGADLNAVVAAGEMGCTALQYCWNRLLCHPHNDEFFYSAFDPANVNPTIAVIKLLLEHGANPWSIQPPRPWQQEEIYHDRAALLSQQYEQWYQNEIVGTALYKWVYAIVSDNHNNDNINKNTGTTKHYNNLPLPFDCFKHAIGNNEHNKEMYKLFVQEWNRTKERAVSHTLDHSL